MVHSDKPAAAAAISQKKAKQLTVIGDLHGNTMKLLRHLSDLGIITNLDESMFNKLDAAYQASHNVLEDDTDYYGVGKVSLVNIKRFCALLEKLEFSNSRAEAISLCFLGDMLADRGKNDFLTLKVLMHMRKNGVTFVIIHSNHDAEFLRCIPYILNTERHKKVYAEVVSFRQAPSLTHLRLLLQLKDEAILSEIPALVRNYTDHLTLIELTNSDKKYPVIMTHAPFTDTSANTILTTAMKLSKKEDELLLTEVVTILNQDYQQNILKPLFDKEPSEAQIAAQNKLCDESNYLGQLAWAREAINHPNDVFKHQLLPGQIACHIHGHDKKGIKRYSNSVNLDNTNGLLEAIEFNTSLQNEVCQVMLGTDRPPIHKQKEIEISPAPLEQSANKLIEICGDLHANPMKLLLRLSKLGIIKNLDTYFDELSSAYHESAYPITEPRPKNAAATEARFLELLKKLSFNHRKVKAVYFCFTGNLLAGSGSNDAFMLELLLIMADNHVKFDTVYSYHDRQFIKNIPNIKNPERYKEIEHDFKNDRASSLDRLKHRLLELGNNEQESQRINRLVDNFLSHVKLIKVFNSSKRFPMLVTHAGLNQTAISKLISRTQMLHNLDELDERRLTIAVMEEKLNKALEKILNFNISEENTYPLAHQRLHDTAQLYNKEDNSPPSKAELKVALKNDMPKILEGIKAYNGDNPFADKELGFNYLNSLLEEDDTPTFIDLTFAINRDLYKHIPENEREAFLVKYHQYRFLNSNSKLGYHLVSNRNPSNDFQHNDALKGIITPSQILHHIHGGGQNDEQLYLYSLNLSNTNGQTDSRSDRIHMNSDLSRETVRIEADSNRIPRKLSPSTAASPNIQGNFKNILPTEKKEGDDDDNRKKNATKNLDAKRAINIEAMRMASKLLSCNREFGDLHKEIRQALSSKNQQLIIQLKAAHDYLSSNINNKKSHANGIKQTLFFVRNMLSFENPSETTLKREAQQWICGYGYKYDGSLLSYGTGSGTGPTSRIQSLFTFSIFGELTISARQARTDEEISRALLNWVSTLEFPTPSA